MRIKTLCSLIKPCNILADIGCDHALVSAYAIRNKLADKVYAVDISETAVNKAKNRLARYAGATAILSNGFTNLPEKVDTAVIAGMGGMKIIEILQQIDYRPSLVLGAQHDAYRLRNYLNTNGYKITQDFCLFDHGKFYDFICAESGQGEVLDEIQLNYGKFFATKNPSLKIKVEKELSQLVSYGTNSSKERISFAKEVLKWQQ
ncbi:MAG: SAM-dependent methyltransferase [Clostridia bacterium]|nr:SAM-dependent methyltransferase [Clostridia bacterium]